MQVNQLKKPSVVRILLLIALIVNFTSCNDGSENEMLTYLSVLKKYDFRNVSIRKVLVDPSYNFPYNVYIKLSLNESYHKQLIKDLGLITKDEAKDTASMKIRMNIDEYQLYFKMSSINKSRNSSLQEDEEDIGWWPRSFEGPVYAGSYLDIGNERRPVLLNQKRNGRIAASIKGSTIYFLIECWG